MNDNIDTLSLAYEHQQAGRFKEAESLCRQILKGEPNNVDALHLLGVLMYRQEKLQESAELISKAVEIDPEYAEGHYNLANVLDELGKPDQAIASFQRAIKLNPDYAKAHYNLGIIFKEQNKLDDATESFQRAIACDPNYAKAHNNLGMVFKEQGKLDEALASFQKAIACDPRCAPVYNNMGIVLKNLKKLKEAVSAYAKAIDLDPNYADAYANLGIALKEQNRVDVAITAFRHAIAVDPKHTQAYYNMGGALEEQGKTQEAIAAYQRTVELDPENHAAKHLLMALKGETTDAAPTEYVKGLFDSYTGFDQHLTERLHYKTPTVLRETLDKILSKPRRFHNVLDLGCGTGLSGLEFRALADHMTGIDLSPKMIEEAKKKNVYDDLHIGEVAEFLDKSQERYDLFIAADVFVYIGNLDPIFKLVKTHAAEEALFLFSVEHCEKNYTIQPSGRYAHSLAYIQSLAEKYCFNVETCLPSELRKEKGQWLMGDLFVLKVLPA